MPFLETILARDGGFPYLHWHQHRLEKTLAAHGIAKRYALHSLLRAPETGRWRCRVIYSAAEFSAEYLPYQPRSVHWLKAVCDDAIDYRYKDADRSALEHLFAMRGNADDVLIIKNGLVTDTTIANTAFFDGTYWRTPQSPLLEGTARARLIAEGFIHPERITPEQAVKAKKVAVMNALSGFVEVSGGILLPKEKKAEPC